MRSAPRADDEAERGAHTLRVLAGTIVGINGDDVFVELEAPRMQGVISRRLFATPPCVGDEHEFTLRGQEESLWVLALCEEESLASWEEMEIGSLVAVRFVRVREGGLEGKVGPLHAFVPKSQTGLAREKSPDVLVGKELVCEVIEVDHERQRCVLSRKSVVRRDQQGRGGPKLGNLVPGQVIQGRVSRVAPFGVFVRFGQGMEGLVHVSNLAWRHVPDPAEIVKVGEIVAAKVLAIRAQGKRIALGMKQLESSPWESLARHVSSGAILRGRVVRTKPYGLFVEVVAGVTGLLHRSEAGLGPDESLGRLGSEGREVAVRVLSIDVERERLALSSVHPGGSWITLEEAETFEPPLETQSSESSSPAQAVQAAPVGGAEREPGGMPLGPILRRFLEERGV